MTTLLSINDFQDYLKISNVVQIEELNPFVIQSQTRFLKPILCNEQYNDIIEAYDLDTYTDLQAALLVEIKPALVFRSYSLFLTQNNLVPSKYGMREYEDPEGTSSTISPERFDTLVKTVSESATFYENALRVYLNSKEDDYPLYKNSDCSCQKQKSPVYIAGVGSKPIVQMGKGVKITII